MTLVAGIGVAISACEDLTAFDAFRDHGLLSWSVARWDAAWSARGFTGRVADFVLGATRFRLLLLSRLAAALVAVGWAAAGAEAPWAALLVLACSSAALFLRTAHGHDGAQQMLLLVLAALFLHRLAPAGSLAARSCLWFIALQSALAYFIAGINKLLSATWRDGTALVGILGTRTYGHDRASSLLRRFPALSIALSWVVVLFECGFAAALFAGEGVAAAVLGAGLFFHVANAVFMGLNGFVFAFVATYPAVLYVSACGFRFSTPAAG